MWLCIFYSCQKLIHWFTWRKVVLKQNHYSFAIKKKHLTVAMELEKLIVLFFLVGLQLKWFVFGKANPVLILIQIWSQRNTSAQHGQMFVVKLAIELVKPWIWCPITGLYNELLSTYCQNYVIIHTTYILFEIFQLQNTQICNFPTLSLQQFLEPLD